MIYSFQIKVNRYSLLLIRCCPLVEEIYIIWSDGLNSGPGQRPALSAIYYPTALMWRSKSGENCKKRPCSRLWSMLITKYYADHKILCWSQGTTLLITGKYITDDREILCWSQGNILVHTDQREIWFASNSNAGGFFLIRPSHPMKQSSDPITILIATMMMMTITMMKKNKRQSMDLIRMLIATMMMMTIIIIMTKHDEEE